MDTIKDKEVKALLGQLVEADSSAREQDHVLIASLENIALSLTRIKKTVATMRAYEEDPSVAAANVEIAETTIGDTKQGPKAAKNLASSAADVSEEVVSLLQSIYTGRSGASQHHGILSHRVGRSAQSSRAASYDRQQQPSETRHEDPTILARGNAEQHQEKDAQKETTLVVAEPSKTIDSEQQGGDDNENDIPEVTSTIGGNEEELNEDNTTGPTTTTKDDSKLDVPQLFHHSSIRSTDSEFFTPTSPNKADPVETRARSQQTDVPNVAAAVSQTMEEPKPIKKETIIQVDPPIISTNEIGTMTAAVEETSTGGSLKRSPKTGPDASALTSEECTAIVRLSQANETLKKQLAFQQRFIAGLRKRVAYDDDEEVVDIHEKQNGRVRFTDEDAQLLAREVSDESFMVLNTAELNQLISATSTTAHIGSGAASTTSSVGFLGPSTASQLDTSVSSVISNASTSFAPVTFYFCGMDVVSADMSVSKIKLQDRSYYVKVGDVITSVNGKATPTASELHHVVSTLPHNIEAVTLGTLRDGISKTVKIPVVAPPEHPAPHPLLLAPKTNTPRKQTTAASANTSSPLGSPKLVSSSPDRVTFARQLSSDAASLKSPKGTPSKHGSGLYSRTNTYTGHTQ